jgi:hypothetical protein
MIAQTCNPSYLGCEDQEDQSLPGPKVHYPLSQPSHPTMWKAQIGGTRLAGQKCETLTQKLTKAKWTGGLTQLVKILPTNC